MVKKVLMIGAALAFVAGSVFAGGPHLASKASVKVDSKFPSYEGDVLTDNLYPDTWGDDNKAAWEDHQKSWASADRPKDHWAEITMAKAEKVSVVEIYWDKDKGKYKTAKSFKIQYWDGAAWVDAAEVKDPAIGEVTVVPVNFTAQKIRYFQPKGNGPVGRLNIAWLCEIVVK